MDDLIAKILAVTQEKMARIGITRIPAMAVDANRPVSSTELAIAE